MDKFIYLLKRTPLLGLSIILVGCGWSDILPFVEGADNVADTGAALGIPYTGIASGLTGFLVEFVRGRIEKKGILKQAGALYRGVDAHMATLSQEERDRGYALMTDSVKAIVGKNRYDKANKLLHTAKSISTAS